MQAAKQILKIEQTNYFSVDHSKDYFGSIEQIIEQCKGNYNNSEPKLNSWHKLIQKLENTLKEGYQITKV